MDVKEMALGGCRTIEVNLGGCLSVTGAGQAAGQEDFAHTVRAVVFASACIHGETARFPHG